MGDIHSANGESLGEVDESRHNTKKLHDISCSLLPVVNGLSEGYKTTIKPKNGGVFNYRFRLVQNKDEYRQWSLPLVGKGSS